MIRNDAISMDEIRALGPDAIVLSPGPCSPNEAGCSLDVVRHFNREIPILGVCLGHQTIAAAYGARIVRAPVPMHGRTSDIYHNGQGIFTGLLSPLVACRYHSLIVDEASLPDCLEVTARTADGIVMGLRHRELPVIGVQFHPESILSDAGYQILANFLESAELPVPARLPSIDNELARPAVVAIPQQDRPATF